MTYIFNAGTGYAVGGRAARESPTTFPETPYSAAEESSGSSTSSSATAGAMTATSGSSTATAVAHLVATPNGMLMGLGGNWIQGLFSQQGGTAWGDIFMVNIDRCSDPCEQLRHIVRSGHAWYTDRRGVPVQSRLNLDRVLHHEERHSAQWAAKGYLRMLRDYGWELVRERAFGKTNRLEDDAGLADGGYR